MFFRLSKFYFLLLFWIINFRLYPNWEKNSVFVWNVYGDQCVTNVLLDKIFMVVVILVRGRGWNKKKNVINIRNIHFAKRTIHVMIIWKRDNELLTMIFGWFFWLSHLFNLSINCNTFFFSRFYWSIKKMKWNKYSFLKWKTGNSFILKMICAVQQLITAA